MTVGNILQIIDYVMNRYGWSIEYTMTQPLRRLYLLSTYGLSYDIEERKTDPVFNLLKQVYTNG